MEKLEKQLFELIEQLENSKQLEQELNKLSSVLPFNKYEFILMNLLNQGKIKYDDYIEIRESYIDRNLYLSVFEISSPRVFGDSWAFGHLMQIEERLKRPRNYDPEARGRYDLCLQYDDRLIRIEVKASRVNDRDRAEDPLYLKALSSDTDKNYLMNFQQLKPSCCDVFIWIAVFRDTVRYWVLGSSDVQTHPLFTPQHRNEGTELRQVGYDRTDIFEGQIMMTNINVSQFNVYSVRPSGLYDAIINRFLA